MYSQLQALQLLRRPPTGYALMDGTSTVGWIRPGIVGLGGYPTRIDAYFAAEAGAAFLKSWSRTREQRVPVPFSHPVPVSERVRLDDRVVARIASPDETARHDAEGFGFEIAVPKGSWLSVMLEMAQHIRVATAEWRRNSSVGHLPVGAA